MQWIMLLLTGVFEVGWALAMKYSNKRLYCACTVYYCGSGLYSKRNIFIYGIKTSAIRNCVCHVDRIWNHRHFGSWDISFRREAYGAASNLCHIDNNRDCRIKNVRKRIR